MKPICKKVNFSTGTIRNTRKTRRYLSDLVDIYQDRQSAEDMLKKKDVLVYEVDEVTVPNGEGHLVHGTSILYPGKVGKEYFMTRGHFHTKEDEAEVYFCLKGKGYLVMQTRKADVSRIKMSLGTVVYVPPLWAHRTVNTGKEKFICFYVVSGIAGNSYEQFSPDFRLD